MNITEESKHYDNHKGKYDKVKKIVYISHPFGGKYENIVKNKKLLLDLTKKYEGYQFVMPVLQYADIYHSTDYEFGLELCLNLMDICDEVWFCEGWENSTGCREEFVKAMTTPNLTAKIYKPCKDMRFEKKAIHN